MAKRNCWEFKNCGRQRGGVKVAELGICPAATEVRLHQVNGGRFGGRVCWAIAGTLCGGKVQGSFASKTGNCTQCAFFQTVCDEEGPALAKLQAVFEKLK